MDKAVIEKVKQLVNDELKKHGKEYERKLHFAKVRDYAMWLAEQHPEADKEIVELSAWLHDIARIETAEEDHHVKGAEKAGKILKGFGYPEDRIKKVQHCVISHRGKENQYKPETIEARIVASADAMSHFDTTFNIAWIGAKMGMDMLETIEWLKAKLERDWEKKLYFPEAKEKMRDKYEAFKLLVRDL